MKPAYLLSVLVGSPFIGMIGMSSAIACSNYWINPKTQQEECFDGNLNLTGPSETDLFPTRQEKSDREPLSYLTLFNRAQFSYIDVFQKAATDIPTLDRAFRARRLSTSVAQGLNPKHKFKTIPATTANYSYRIKLAAPVRTAINSYFPYWVEATPRKPGLYTYLMISVPLFARGSGSSTATVTNSSNQNNINVNSSSNVNVSVSIDMSLSLDNFCKSLTPQTSIPNTYRFNSDMLGQLNRKSEQLTAKYNASISQTQTTGVQRALVQESKQLFLEYWNLLKCPAGFEALQVDDGDPRMILELLDFLEDSGKSN